MRLFCVLVTGVLVLSSCKEKKMTPLEFGKEISAIDDSLKGMGQRWSTHLGNAFMSGNYSALKPVRDSLSSFIDLKIKEVSNMSDVGGSENLRKAELEFLKYEKKTIDSSFVIFESFDERTSELDKAFAAQDINDYSDGEEVVVERLRRAQSEYAQKNNLEIIKNK